MSDRDERRVVDLRTRSPTTLDVGPARRGVTLAVTTIPVVDRRRRTAPTTCSTCPASAPTVPTQAMPSLSPDGERLAYRYARRSGLARPRSQGVRVVDLRPASATIPSSGGRASLVYQILWSPRQSAGWSGHGSTRPGGATRPPAGPSRRAGRIAPGSGRAPARCPRTRRRRRAAAVAIGHDRDGAARPATPDAVARRPEPPGDSDRCDRSAARARATAAGERRASPRRYRRTTASCDGRSEAGARPTCPAGPLTVAGWLGPTVGCVVAADGRVDSPGGRPVATRCRWHST